MYVETNVDPDDFQDRKIHRRGVFPPDLSWVFRPDLSQIGTRDLFSRSCLEVGPQICPRAHTRTEQQQIAKMRQPLGQFVEQLPLDPRAPRSAWSVACCGAGARSCVFRVFTIVQPHPSKNVNECISIAVRFCI